MDINAKKLEIVQHILIINDPDNLIKIDRFIHGLEIDDSSGYAEPMEEQKSKSRVNVMGSKIKSMLNMYDK